MITMKEAKQFKDEYYENQKANRQKRAEEWCETVAYNAIEKTAKEGKGVVELAPPEDIISEIRTYLTVQNFSVGMCDTRIIVKW